MRIDDCRQFGRRQVGMESVIVLKHRVREVKNGGLSGLREITPRPDRVGPASRSPLKLRQSHGPMIRPECAVGLVAEHQRATLRYPARKVSENRLQIEYKVRQ